MAKKIAKIIIEGTIQKENENYKQEWVLETIEKVKKTPSFAGIIVYINSPGGAVFEADEVYEALLSYKAETKKPVYAYFASLAASGGYYIGCAADKIIANRNSLTGSIGVIAGKFVDLTELMKKYGVKSQTIHSGRNKTMGSFDEVPTEEQKQIMQSISDECYEQFTQIVAESRKLDIEKVKELADGRIYTAKQAKELGLVDEIANFEDAVKIFKQDVLGDKESPAEVKELKMKPKKSLAKMLKGTKMPFDVPQSLLDLAEMAGKLKKSVPFPAYYFEWNREL